MSFLGIGARQPSSEEKVKAVESEMRLLADMLNRYVPRLLSPSSFARSIPSRYRPGADKGHMQNDKSLH